MLAGTPLIGRQQIYPNGQLVNCNNNSDSDPLQCIDSNNTANITVYRSNGQTFNEYNLDENDNEFKCCTQQLF